MAHYTRVTHLAQRFPSTKPLVVDPFAGGGSIPLEALRVGADAFASDLNPIAVLLNKVVLEYIPKYAQRLTDEVRKWGEWIKREAEKELAEFYPKDPDGATPIAYLWARTIKCEGPGCGAEVPLIHSLWLVKKANRSVALQFVPRPRAKRVDFQIIVKQRGGWVDQAQPKEKIADPKFDGTVKRGSATCPCCGYTTPVARVREQLKARRGGANDARFLCVVNAHAEEKGRFYRLPTKQDLKNLSAAACELERRERCHDGPLDLLPSTLLPTTCGGFMAPPTYGHRTWSDLFNRRQALALATIVRLIREARTKMDARDGLSDAVVVCLALALGRIADLANSLCGWTLDTECTKHLFGRQAIPIVWNFAEGVPISDSAGSWGVVVDRFPEIFESISGIVGEGSAMQANATRHFLPDDSAQALITDPPYYNAVPYADLSDFFFVWLQRAIGDRFPTLFRGSEAPKEDEVCEMASWDSVRFSHKDGQWFESKMCEAMHEGRRIIQPRGIGTVVFAHKSTGGWEAVLQSILAAGWVITASWPIDTEMGTRLRARNSAALASSVHLVCRPRENPDGSVRADEVGDWRDVLAELPLRIHDWMPRLAEEGVVGADAIFACLGPALEIFSRYSRVEKASGEAVTLKEYLEQVWAAVAKEALTMIFTGADATGFEEDARLTAMWLWTLKTGDTNGAEGEGAEEDASDDDDGGGDKRASVSGFSLQYDAARKIAQGLGAHLEELTSLVEVKGETARLLSVAERTKHLFGKDEASAPATRRKKKSTQLTLGFEAELERVEETGGWGAKGAPQAGTTVLDRIHQAMILFAAGRGEALRRFLVDEGVGRNERFWRLAQALSALYPPNTDEKRWVDGVMARKKGLGL